MRRNLTKSFPKTWRAWVLLLAVGLSGPLADIDAGSSNDTLADYSTGLRQKFSDVQTISPEELATQIDKFILLDVRDEREFAVSHLPGSHRVAGDAVAQIREFGATPQSPIVVYCSVGYRSALLARDLQKSGFTNVRNLDGSIFAWANEGRGLVNADGPTHKVHPFNVTWGRYLDRSKWQWEPNRRSDP